MRETPAKTTRRERKRADRRRASHLREIQHWVSVIERVDERFKEASAVPWYVIDREGDGYAILASLLASSGFFTVRASHNRIVGHEIERTNVAQDRSVRRRRHLRAEMRRARVLGHYELDV